MSANESPNRSSRDRIRTSKFAPYQLAQLVTLQVQRAHHAADDYIEHNLSELAKVALVSGALAIAAILRRRKSREEEPSDSLQSQVQYSSTFAGNHQFCILLMHFDNAGYSSFIP